MKTALQELKENILQSNEIHLTCKVVVISHLESLEEKEKQDLIDAYNQGSKDGILYYQNPEPIGYCGEDYYNETFKQD